MSTDQIPHLLREAVQLADDGLLNKEDNKFVEILQQLRQKRRIREMAECFNHEMHTANLSALEPLCSDIDFTKEAPSLSRLRQCMQAISGGTVTSNTFQPQEVSAIFDSLIPYLKEVNSIETRYREVYERLRELTASRRLIHFRKMVHDNTTAIPTEEDFTTSWKWRQAKSTKKPKQKKRPKKAPKKRKSKAGRREIQLPKILKSTASSQQKEPLPAAEASPSPLPAAVAASPAPVAPAQTALNYQYADRVLQFLDPAAQGATRNEIEHGFGRAVDRYVERLGIKTTWKEKDPLFSIPGEMEYQGEVHRGVFTYCFDGKTPNRCYHRCFMRKPADEMIAEFSDKGFWEFDFPELRAVHTEAYPGFKRAEDGSRVVKEYRNVVEIKDPRNGATIRLFKVKD